VNGTASEIGREGILTVMWRVIVRNQLTGVVKEGAAAPEAVWLVAARFDMFKRKFWRPKRMTMTPLSIVNVALAKVLAKTSAPLDQGVMGAAFCSMTDGGSLLACDPVHTMTDARPLVRPGQDHNASAIQSHHDLIESIPEYQIDGRSALWVLPKWTLTMRTVAASDVYKQVAERV